MNQQQLINDQRFLFRDLPTEWITISDVERLCLCIGARDRKDLEIGGFQELPTLEIAMERGQFSELPEQGQRVTFRGKSFRVGEIIHDHPQSPIRFTLESPDK